MKRRDIITVSPPGDYRKPRPAVVIKSDWRNKNDSVLEALFTSTLVEAPIYRLSIEPGEANGLKQISQIMVDKILPVMRGKCGRVIGQLDRASLSALNQIIAIVTGIAD